MNERVDLDKRFSKYNYGSRKVHSIKNDLLEKRLTFDHAKNTEELNVHATSDLEACYDRKIPELCGLVEESIGANHKVINLLTKVSLRLEHHAGTVNGIIAAKYGGGTIY